MSNYDKAVHVIELTNLLAPDAYIASRGDFAYGEDQVTIRTREAAFPILSLNTFDRETGSRAEGVLPSVLIQLGNVLVGLIGTISPSMVDTFTSEYTQIVDPINAVREEVSRLRDQGADLIIVCLDGGDPDITTFREANLGVDSFIQDEPVADIFPLQEDSDFYIDTERGDILFASATLNDGAWEWQSDVMAQTDFDPDGEAQNMIGDLLKRFDRIMNIPVATVDVEFDTREPFVRTQESGFASLVADILREETGADIALINSGQIRGATVYQPGTIITRRSIQTELPFTDAFVIVELSGQQVIDALEHGVSNVENLDGRFLQVSGLSYGYDPNRPAGERLTFARYRGAVIDPNTALSVAMPSFIAEGGDGYTMFETALKVYQDQTFILWERVMNNLRGRTDVTFAPMDRIVQEQ